MRRVQIAVAIFALLGVVGAGVFFLTRDKVQRPGTISNPKLVELMNRQVATWGTRQTGAGMNGTHQQGAAAWMQEIAEISVNYIEPFNRKFRHFQAELTLRDGAHVSARCGNNAAMVVRFKLFNGLATDAWTDGSELKNEMAIAIARLDTVIDCVIRVDMDRHPTRYFNPAPAEKSPAEMSQEWK